MRALVAWLVAVCVATLAGLLSARDGLTPALSSTALGAGALAGIAAFAATRGLPRGKPFRGWAAWSMATVFALFALRTFCWLIFNKEDKIDFLSPNNLGDLSLHLTFINYFAGGAPLWPWPANPIFSALPLHYPFGIDFFNSLLTCSGLSLQHGLIWVGLAGALATGVALWRWGGAFAMAGFLFNGGLAILAVMHTHHWENLQEPLDWKSIPLALFVTQRGLLYAIPAGLALLWSWRERFFRGTRGLPFWVEALLYATMPLFHLHTFLFLSAMLGAWLLLPPLEGLPSPRSKVLKLGLTAFIPATLLVFELTGGGQAGSVIHLSKGWIGQNMSWPDAVLQNFGVLPLLIVAMLFWFAARKRQPATVEYLAFTLPALMMAAVACFVIFAPWAWDNTKLLLWSYLAILPALGAFLREEGGVAVRVLACVALFASGAVSLARGLDGRHQGYELADREELDALHASLQGIPRTAVFACEPTFNHPLLLLGYKAVAGYEGHLYSHGIDYKGRFDALERLLRNEPGWAARARELGADFLFWGPREREKYGTGDGNPWRGLLPVVAKGTWGTLYDLRGARENLPAPPLPSLLQPTGNQEEPAHGSAAQDGLR